MASRSADEDMKRLDALRHSAEAHPQSDVGFLLRLLDEANREVHRTNLASADLMMKMGEISSAWLYNEGRLKAAGALVEEIAKCWTMAGVRSVLRRFAEQFARAELPSKEEK